MKNFLLGSFFALILVGVAIWYYADVRKNPDAERAKSQIQSTASDVKNSVQSKLDSWNLHPETIKEELARTGKVVRQKTGEVSEQIADASADARITAAIKAKLVADRDLSALGISVNTTAGVVTLSGTVSSTENIQKAILLTMDTQGVKKVESTLQVKGG
ncbi:BON domain-containing protein [Pedosphaera parvula]|uniref:Transport-associated protein n=1 Tax=Pedosphaera parvula (strain Ellin514) TaxID=320771 RepID=B9XMW7_PEDPL|nr:BON domain-containing protein [Pedosphaera parvula]EEF58763.1 transport-associated protein [Pedosphaera parvula Ellin514]